MRANLLSDKILIQQKTITQGALGQTVVWKPVQIRHGRKLPVDTWTRNQYMQNNSVVTHRMVFEEGVDLDKTYRFKHGGNTYEPIEPPQTILNNTVILVKES